MYSKEYENVITQLYFNEKISDGKMTEEEAAKTLFYICIQTVIITIMIRWLQEQFRENSRCMYISFREMRSTLM
ncbi:hypothetical protein ROSEINA2194_01618 [Roseburia inulinivorans DSM 16841]|uniref:Uncharacterized protein n=2 Tax=Roseburia inulinivorans TaxID=360807 RepID=C0FSA2_9FIRM|nr:hypothetical protein ROSEINA2194_01618 [Roseburia inulinivorans DSM 16841]